MPTSEAIYNFLIERIRANLHIILCMSPIGDAFRNRIRQYPSLINCTTIDWFLEWPREALLEVGNKFLMDLNLIVTITGENKIVRVRFFFPSIINANKKKKYQFFIYRNQGNRRQQFRWLHFKKECSKEFHRHFPLFTTLFYKCRRKWHWN